MSRSPLLMPKPEPDKEILIQKVFDRVLDIPCTFLSYLNTLSPEELEKMEEKIRSGPITDKKQVATDIKRKVRSFGKLLNYALILNLDVKFTIEEDSKKLSVSITETTEF